MNERDCRTSGESDGSETRLVGSCDCQDVPCEEAIATPQGFLSSDPGKFFPMPITGNDDSSSPPAWFLEAVHDLWGKETRLPSTHRSDSKSQMRPSKSTPDCWKNLTLTSEN